MPKKQKDNRYRAKLTVGYDADGQPVYKYISGRTQNELTDAKKAAEAYYINGEAKREDILFDVYAKQWYDLTKKPNLGLSSKGNYNSMLNKHVYPAFQMRNLRAITYTDLQKWINQFEGKGKSTITHAAACIRGVFSSAFFEGYIEKDPSARLRLPRAAKPKKKRALTEEERKRVIATSERHEHGLYLAILYYLGLRRGEALGLKWGDIDWDSKLVHIQRDIDFAAPAADAEGDVKTEESDRKIVVPDMLLDRLQPLQGDDNVFIFTAKEGKPLSKASAERMWIQLMIDAGFAVPAERSWKRKDIRSDWDPGITPHYLRHNYITMLWEGGIDPVIAMRLVGHKDYKTTVEIYTHLDKIHLKNAGNQINSVFEKLPESCQKSNIVMFPQRKTR
ncbi:MAG: site-specific integrase [Clostridia bacterium]|nr:site-specific integrase [Clostridia bacterium]